MLHELIPKYYKEYGDSVNNEKMFPLNIDGLIPVQMKILLTAYTVAKTSFVKTTKILGTCMSNWHPHSDAEGTCAWGVYNGFLDYEGQWGSPDGISPSGWSAPRYTKLKANNEVLDIAFKYINDVEWVYREGDEKEPIALPTMLPFCLMAKHDLDLMGFGFKTTVPTYSIPDLVMRLQYLLDVRKNNKDKLDEPIIKPEIPGCKILSNDGELKELLETGSGKITLKGMFRKNNKKYKVHLLGWSNRITFQNLLNKIDRYGNYNLLTNKSVGFVDESDKTGTKITFEVIKTRNKEEIYNNLIETFENVLISTNTYSIYTTDLDKQTDITSVDEYLLNCYEFYNRAYERNIKRRIEDKNKQIRTVDVILKIRKYLPELIDDKRLKFDGVCKKLNEYTEISIEEISEILKTRSIRYILESTINKDKYEDDLKELLLEQAESAKRCMSQYIELGDKYATGQ